MVIAACGSGAAHRGRTVVYASGADLQSVNPLLTVHPFAKQVERYVLLTTLVRYDSALVPRPYLARAWTWSEDRKSLTFRLQPGVRWGDGVPTTARDVAWTLSAARDAATGYPRLNDFADVAFVNDPNDSTVVIRFAHSQDAVQDVLTDLDMLPAHLLDSDPSVRLAAALALDRREIVDGYLYGFGSVADGPVPPDVPGYVPVRPVPTNPDSARRLLGGRRIAFELLTVGSGEAALEQMIQARLAAVGFDVAIRQLELGAFLARVNGRQRDFTAAVVGTPGDPGLGYLTTLAELAGLRPGAEAARA